MERIQCTNGFDRKWSSGALNHFAVDAKEDPVIRGSTQSRASTCGISLGQITRQGGPVKHAIALDECKVRGEDELSAR